MEQPQQRLQSKACNFAATEKGDCVLCGEARMQASGVATLPCGPVWSAALVRFLAKLGAKS